jgi:hypothetical protein
LAESSALRYEQLIKNVGNNVIITAVLRQSNTISYKYIYDIYKETYPPLCSIKLCCDDSEKRAYRHCLF